MVGAEGMVGIVEIVEIVEIVGIVGIVGTHCRASVPGHSGLQGPSGPLPQNQSEGLHECDQA